MLQNNSTLKSLIDKLWQNFWEGGIANPLTAIEQITYLIFMKRLDDLEAKRERDAEFTGENYSSRFKAPSRFREVRKRLIKTNCDGVFSNTNLQTRCCCMCK